MAGEAKKEMRRGRNGRMKVSRSATAMALGVMLTACGGGSSGGGVESTVAETTTTTVSPLASYKAALQACADMVPEQPPTTDTKDVLFWGMMSMRLPEVGDKFVSFAARFDPSEKDGEGGTYDQSIEFDHCLDAVAQSVPGAVRAKMEQTRALDGTQTDIADGLKFTWNYHPDRGLSVTIELA